MSRLLTEDMGESYSSTKMDASIQDRAILPCRFSRHALYLLPRMSNKRENEDYGVSNKAYN
jgi:hypothetical protein